MEGEILCLRGIVDVVKKYKAYIYVDEAHSIGAIGQTGRGICEYSGVDPSEIDVLMGTFSKSFGVMGGYVAASKEIISFIRYRATSLDSAEHCGGVGDCTDTGRKKIASLRENSNYFRQKLLDMGLVTLGDFDSPVIPVMLYVLSKIADHV